MAEYTCSNIIIDPTKEGIESLIGKEVYFHNNPSLCLENCFHKDDYGICKCGSRCEVYDVQIAPEEDTATKINRSIEVKRANEFQKKI